MLLQGAVGLVGIDEALQDFITDARQRAQADAEAARIKALEAEEIVREEARLQAEIDEAQAYLDANPMQAAVLAKDPYAQGKDRRPC